MVQLCVAAVASVLPAGSVALTSNACGPSDSPVYDFGDEQAAKAAPSSRHSKLEFASVELNSNTASVAFTVPVGPSIDVSGGDVSMVKVLVPLRPRVSPVSDCFGQGGVGTLGLMDAPAP